MMSAFASGWNVDRPQEDAGGQQLQPAPVVDIPGTGPFKTQAPGRERSLGDGEERELLEQGPALSRRHRVLPRRCRSRRSWARRSCPTASTTRRIVDPVTARKAKATPGMSSTDFYQSVIQGTWIERQEEAVRRSAGAARLPSGARQAGAGRRGEGRGADDGRRLHLPVLRVRHAEGRARQAGRLPGRSDRGDQGGQGADGRRGLRQRHQGPRLPGARGRHLQAVGAGHPGHAAADAERRVQAAHRGRIGVVRRHQDRATSIWRSAPSSRRCSIRRTTSTPGTRRTGRRTTASGTTTQFNALLPTDRHARSIRPSAWR